MILRKKDTGEEFLVEKQIGENYVLKSLKPVDNEDKYITLPKFYIDILFDKREK